MKDTFRNIILFLLTLEAKAVLRKYKPKIIVVTGSVGKTSTKDATFTALKNSFFVRKSEKSFNSDIGVPLTILGLPNGWSNIFVWLKNLLKGLGLVVSSAPYPTWLVIEVGADRPGDISKSLAWVKPDIVITTAFPEVPVHVEFYDSPEAVAKEELFPLSLLNSGDVAVLNETDPYASTAPLGEGVRRITYGTEKESVVRGMRYRVTVRKGVGTGISFDVVYEEQKAQVVLSGVVGVVHMQSVLAGIAGALASGVTLEEAVQGFDAHVFPPGRLRLISGKKESLIIDDSYNASPVAMKEALSALASAPTAGKRIAVLGDMFELGKFSVQEHTQIGKIVGKHADIVVTVGVRARAIAETARTNGVPESRVHSFDTLDSSIEFLTTFVESGDSVLVKGSQGMRMERVVKALMQNPENAHTLLPRQDDAWRYR